MSVLETIRAQLVVARRVVDVLERAVEEIEAAQQGEPTAPGSTGGAPPPTHVGGGSSSGRRRPADARPRASKGAAYAQPVADEGAGHRPPRRAARPAVEGEKYCRACDTSKPVAEFNKNATARDGLQSQCRPCQRKTIARSASKPAEEPAPSKPAGWVDPAARLKLIRERAARGAS